MFSVIRSSGDAAIPQKNFLSSGARAVSEALGHRYVRVEAPSGWGKTTAVRDAVAGHSTIWCDVGAAPQERGAVVFCLAHALCLPTENIVPLLQSAARRGSYYAVCAWLKAALSSHESSVIVFDDLQVISDDDVSLGFIKQFTESIDHRIVLVMRPNVRLASEAWLASCAKWKLVTQQDLALSLEDPATLSLPVRASGMSPAALFRITGGYPAAVHFALLALRHDGGEPYSVSSNSSYNYLSTRFLRTLNSEKQALVADVALAGKFDAQLIAELGYSADLMNWLYSGDLPIQESGGDWRLHDLVADIIRAHVGPTALASRAEYVVAALTRRGWLGQAFDVAGHYAPGALGDLFTNSGEALFESGRWESFRSAIDLLPVQVKSQPTMLAMRAWIERAEGNDGQAEALLTDAISKSHPSGELRWRLLKQLTYLYNANLSPKAATAAREALLISPAGEQCRDRACYAMALAIAGRAEEAAREAEQSITQAEASGNQHLVWDAYYCGLQATYHGGKTNARYFKNALRAARRLNDMRAIATAYSHLAADGDLDSTRRMQALNKMQLALREVQDPSLKIYAQLASYRIATERGNKDWIDQLNFDSLEQGWVFDGQLHAVIANAMRLAWDGRFHDAYNEITSAPLHFWNALYERRWQASVALFASLARKHVQALEALSAIDVGSTGVGEFAARINNVSRIYATFAEIFLGRGKHAAHRVPAPMSFGEDALCEALRDLAVLPTPPPKKVVMAVATHLAEREQEGWSSLLVAWANERCATDSEIGLTSTELDILRRVSDGATAKEIAFGTGRSVETVRNHIKSVIRKTGASGRLEALAIARRVGLLSK